MASEKSWILLCVVLFSVGVTTRSYENFDFRDYEELPFQRSRQPQQQNDQEDFDIRMPSVQPKKHDTYFCTSKKMSDSDTYIVGYTPHAEMHTAHHMLLFGCEIPAREEKYWNCGDMGAGVCRRGSKEKILYAWGRNAPVLKLPKGVAFKVGKSTAVKYLVLQVHYGHVKNFLDNPSLKDISGVSLNTSKKRNLFLAGIKLLAAGEPGPIPPHKTAWHLDVGCQYDNPAVISAFAFRVHAHSLGTVISGYRVRKNKWTLIGKGDPQRPQAFYQTDNTVNITRGDSLAARCTYNSMERDKTTYIGATMKDEMCNFYMMFYYDPSSTSSPPEDFCNEVPQEILAHFPLDSDVPLPGSGKKMEMKRSEIQDENCPRPSCNSKRTNQNLREEINWPLGGAHTGELKSTIGQISAVSLDPMGNVVIFHRGSRPWTYDTFENTGNVLSIDYQTPIPGNTVAWLHPKTGKILREWGNMRFYLPHGLTVDRHNNLWLTDVGAHQVFKYGPYGSDRALITLGIQLQPGNDLVHFCKPTGVAVDSDGSFFVSDGYCNQRVLKYSPKGVIIMQITNDALQAPFLGSPSFNIPHSVSLDVKNKILYVADRENGRVLVFNSESGELLDHINKFGSRVFAAHYSPANGGLLHVVNGLDSGTPVQGYTYSLQDREIIQTWRPNEGFNLPHDVTSDSTGSTVYVAEVTPNRIWKFTEV